MKLLLLNLCLISVILSVKSQTAKITIEHNSTVYVYDSIPINMFDNIVEIDTFYVHSTDSIRVTVEHQIPMIDFTQFHTAPSVYLPAINPCMTSTNVAEIQIQNTQYEFTNFIPTDQSFFCEGDNDIDFYLLMLETQYQWGSILNFHFYNIDVVSIDESYISRINIYPNPVSKELTIDSKDLGVSKIEVVDLSGKLVLRKDFINASQQLDVSFIDKGMYLLCLTMESGEVSTIKFNKE